MNYYSLIKRHCRFQDFLVLFVLGSNLAYSHDFWLEAHPFYTSPAKTVDISVHVGNQFSGDSLPNINSWYTDFSVYQPASKTLIEGEMGRDPAGFFTPRKKGTYAIGYQSDFTNIEIDPDTFLKYLTDEGLGHAIEYRKQNLLTRLPGRENYIRHCKTLIQSGDRFDIDNSMLSFGYELEIIPLSNPYKKQLNDSLSVKVMYQNQPIENLLLIALPKTESAKSQAMRTDRNGVATIRLDQTGPWLLKVVHIIKIKDEQADWQSHWASLTFSISD